MIQNDEIKCSLTEVPFQTTLSFEFLISELKAICENPNHALCESAKKMLRDLDEVPELKKPIVKDNVLRKNKDLVDRLMSFVFNPANDELELSAATPPFTPAPFYSSKLFDETIKGQHRELQMAKDFENNKMVIAIIYQAYLVILKKFYDFEINVDMPFTCNAYQRGSIATATHVQSAVVNGSLVPIQPLQAPNK